MSISTGNSSNDSPGSSRYSASGHSSRLSSHAMAPRDVILTFSRHPGLPQSENTLAPPDGNRSTSPADPSEYRSHIRYPSRASTSVGRMTLTTRAVIPTPGFSGSPRQLQVWRHRVSAQRPLGGDRRLRGFVIHRMFTGWTIARVSQSDHALRADPSEFEQSSHNPVSLAGFNFGRPNDPHCTSRHSNPAGVLRLPRQLRPVTYVPSGSVSPSRGSPGIGFRLSAHLAVRDRKSRRAAMGVSHFDLYTLTNESSVGTAAVLGLPSLDQHLRRHADFAAESTCVWVRGWNRNRSA